MTTKRDILTAQMSPNLEVCKAYMRITTTDLDASLQMVLRSATLAAEHLIGKYVALSNIVITDKASQSYRLRGPVISITSVKVDDKDVDYTLLDNIITLSTVPSDDSILKVEYKAGMEDVPDDIQAAILMHATRLFNNPEDSVEVLPTASSNLLRPYRSWGDE